MYLDNFTIGADPELFIINSKTQKVVSAVGLIPGVKGEPYADDTMPAGFGIEIDNILGEFNIPPATSRQEFINNILYMQNWIRDFVKNANPDYDIKCSASELVDENQLQSDEAKEFGCSPDYNCYTRRVNPKPTPPKQLRSAGFHIHWGYDGYNVEDSLRIVKLCDLCLGVPSVLLDPDVRRRSIYGKAGAFRLTDYGVEYRSLSSYMMKDIDTLSSVWAGIEQVVSMFNDHIDDLINFSEIQTCINTCDKSLAEKIILKYK